MSGAPPVGLEETKNFLRIDHTHEDALLAGLIRTATTLCEAFVGQTLIVREVEERTIGAGDWRRLAVAPVVAITPPGAGVETAVDGHAIGWIRAAAGVVVTARYQAGLAADWNGVPDTLRQGIMRMVAYLHLHRDDADSAALPAAVTALWRPWRAMPLGRAVKS